MLLFARLWFGLFVGSSLGHEDDGVFFGVALLALELFATNFFETTSSALSRFGLSMVVAIFRSGNSS